MPDIDYRIVEMQFDNKEFERNIKESVESLDNLKKGLQLKDASKGLKSVEKAANSINLNNVNKAIEKINYRLSGVGIIADQIFRRIGNSVYNAFYGIEAQIRRFMISPIHDGLAEYE